ncbi:hypothetical protein [Miniphocaeibacter halophilus]|uniref:Uncharacterized protein n=1 Tax=Miniphocaeibacter halophilus TaxID=2931922 RepID=A0AC61N1Y3_9FIRM|nr:hypothetical protein [Miniphocaeibacter halophilus]QQK08944.1 hypothetical protein JFY71_05250 [Miniphocaeibacter halophilus]
MKKFILVLILIFLVACSSKENSLTTRNIDISKETIKSQEKSTELEKNDLLKRIYLAFLESYPEYEKENINDIRIYIEDKNYYFKGRIDSLNGGAINAFSLIDFELENNGNIRFYVETNSPISLDGTEETANIFSVDSSKLSKVRNGLDDLVYDLNSEDRVSYFINTITEKYNIKMSVVEGPSYVFEILTPDKMDEYQKEYIDTGYDFDYIAQIGTVYFGIKDGQIYNGSFTFVYDDPVVWNFNEVYTAELMVFLNRDTVLENPEEILKNILNKRSDLDQDLNNWTITQNLEFEYNTYDYGFLWSDSSYSIAIDNNGVYTYVVNPYEDSGTIFLINYDLTKYFLEELK